VAKQAGAAVIEVNKEETPLSRLADVTLLGPSASLLPALVVRAGGA
jgi:NAD-dependent SIR2 family protein deacetylase